MYRTITNSRLRVVTTTDFCFTQTAAVASLCFYCTYAATSGGPGVFRLKNKGRPKIFINRLQYVDFFVLRTSCKTKCFHVKFHY